MASLARLMEERLLSRKVFDEASTLRDFPVLVCGEFNTSLASSAVQGNGAMEHLLSVP